MTVCAALALSVAGIAKVTGQAPPQGGTQAPPSPADGVVLAEQYFKNIQVLKGIPVDEFMDTMGMFAAATGMNCVDCHVSDAGGDWAKYANDTAFKQTTRRMVTMVNTLNAGSFGGRPLVTCFTCHRGLRAPATLPSLDLQYGDPPPVDPDQITRATPGAPTSDQILDKYLQALGGAQRVAGITSITGKGSYRAYDDFQLSPFDLYAKAPDQRTTIQHSEYGDMTITYDGKNAWMAAPADIRPFPVVQYSGGNLDGARVDAILEFPGRLKQALTNWQSRPRELGGRSGCANRSGHHAEWFSGETVFRHQDRPLAAFGAIFEFAGGESAGARRLLGLSGGFRCQGPVQTGDHLDRWPDRFSAGFCGSEYGGGCVQVRQAQTAGAAETLRGTAH